MKILRYFFVCAALSVVGAISAQETDSNKEIAKETTQKTYNLYENGKLIKNSVTVHTEVAQNISLDEMEEHHENMDRNIAPKRVMKTVEIDNDADDGIDEKIVFSYTAAANEDFVLVTDKDEILVAIENGEDLQILEDQSFSKENAAKSYVVTDDKGKQVELFLEDYKSFE